jgi:hypothetical protein
MFASNVGGSFAAIRLPGAGSQIGTHPHPSWQAGQDAGPIPT